MSFEMARMRLNVSRLYAKSDKEKEFIKSIENDYNLAVRAYGKITGYNFLLERNKVISASIDYRNPFTDLLNYAQIELLKRNQDFQKQTQESDAIIFSIHKSSSCSYADIWINDFKHFQKEKKLNRFFKIFYYNHILKF